MPSPQTQIPPTMRAWTHQTRGPAHVALSLSTTYPTPSPPPPSSSDILIRVSHVAVQSSSESLFRAFPVIYSSISTTTASIPEIEFSGTVIAAGGNAERGVKDVGTRVIAYQTIPDVILFGRGVLAEYVRLPSVQAVRLPEGVDMAAMGGLLGSGSTALKMVRVGGLERGGRVLVNGASGSVGQVLCQVCKLRGAVVVGVASGGNEEFVRGVGVDEFIDYRAHDPLPDYLTTHYAHQPFDLILDCVGSQPLYAHSPAYLTPTGTVVNVGGMSGVASTLRNWSVNTWWPIWLGGVPRRYVMFSTPPSREDAVVLVRMVEEGRLKVQVDSVFAMSDALEVYKRVGTQRARGRVVVKVERD